MPEAPLGAGRTARTLALLTQTYQHIQRLRAGERLGARPHGGIDDDDDMPADIEEFRFELARRIEAFVASRTDAGGAEGDAAARPVDAV
jgi:hypothetical protein